MTTKASMYDKEVICIMQEKPNSCLQRKQNLVQILIRRDFEAREGERGCSGLMFKDKLFNVLFLGN